MKKALIVLGLIILLIISSCDLNKNHFVGNWTATQLIAGDPPVLFTYHINFTEEMRFVMSLGADGVIVISVAGSYDYTDTTISLHFDPNPDLDIGEETMTYSFSQDHDICYLTDSGGTTLVFYRQ